MQIKHKTIAITLLGAFCLAACDKNASAPQYEQTSEAAVETVSPVPEEIAPSESAQPAEPEPQRDVPEFLPNGYYRGHIGGALRDAPFDNANIKTRFDREGCFQVKDHHSSASGGTPYSSGRVLQGWNSLYQDGWVANKYLTPVKSCAEIVPEFGTYIIVDRWVMDAPDTKGKSLGPLPKGECVLTHQFDQYNNSTLVTVRNQRDRTTTITGWVYDLHVASSLDGNFTPNLLCKLDLSRP